MSTNIQHYSIPAQQAAIRQYAAAHGMTIIRSYVDAGKSGLSLRNREALVALLNDVQEGRANFDVILVYDVSRWGRFQDVDESAYYEYLCRKANILVEYCAEPFTNDGGPLAVILKSIKRAMAAEYSREQSARVHRGACRMVARGYSGGGAPVFGYRRMLVGPDGEEKGLLQKGETGLLRQHHVIFVPGPVEEVRTVQRIYRLYAQRELTPPAIADLLNREHACGRRWGQQKVSQILRSERYIGTNIYNKQSSLLGARRTNNPPEQWIRVPGAYKPIVSADVFAAAQRRRDRRKHPRYTEQKLLDRLRHLLATHGYLSVALVDREARPMYPTYRRFFGGLVPAYERIGYVQPKFRRDDDRWQTSRAIMMGVATSLVSALRAAGKEAAHNDARRMVYINGVPKLLILMAAYVPTASLRLPSWRFANMRTETPPWTLLVRMNKANSGPLDFYLMRKSFGKGRQVRLRDEAFSDLQAYRCHGADEVAARFVTGVHSAVRGNLR